jgi:hypothetical protein
VSLLPSSATAGAAGFTLSVAGANFTATNSGPGSTVLIAGRTRSTLCQSAANCSVTLSSSDLASASNFNVVVQNPNGATSNIVSFIVAAPPSAATNIALTPGAPSATGKDIVVIDLSLDGSSAPQTSNLSVGAIGVYQAATGTCSLNGGLSNSCDPPPVSPPKTYVLFRSPGWIRSTPTHSRGRRRTMFRSFPQIHLGSALCN